MHSHVSRWGKTQEGAGLRGECRGDKCNCSIMDPPGGLGLEGEGAAGREGGRVWGSNPSRASNLKGFVFHRAKWRSLIRGLKCIFRSKGIEDE